MSVRKCMRTLYSKLERTDDFVTAPRGCKQQPAVGRSTVKFNETRLTLKTLPDSAAILLKRGVSVFERGLHKPLFIYNGPNFFDVMQNANVSDVFVNPGYTYRLMRRPTGI